jgi:deazaflavin-dependent oxidoreductase (nitroreductase family)
MQQTVPKAGESPSRIDRIVRMVNPRIMKVAGGRWFPTLSVLHHRGHKSGRMYTTPVSALPRDNYFWFSLAFGEDAGWVRNILAAQECVLRYRATDYELVEPAVLDASTVRAQLPRLMRFGLPIIGATKVIRMRKRAAA